MKYYIHTRVFNKSNETALWKVIIKICLIKIESYLDTRHSEVQIISERSAPFTHSHDVPQGSVLGPIF